MVGIERSVNREASKMHIAFQVNRKKKDIKCKQTNKGAKKKTHSQRVKVNRKNIHVVKCTHARNKYRTIRYVTSPVGK